MNRLIDSLRQTSLIRIGAQYNLDTLTAEQQRIAGILRNRGYYYFRPEYLEYLADTTQRRQQVDLRLQAQAQSPRPRPSSPTAWGMSPCASGTSARVRRYAPPPQRHSIRPAAPEDPAAAPGPDPDAASQGLFTVEAQNRTQTELNKLGIFRSVSLSVTPLDSLRGGETRSTSPSTPSSTTRWRSHSKPTSPPSPTELHRTRHHPQGQQQQPLPRRRGPLREAGTAPTNGRRATRIPGDAPRGSTPTNWGSMRT